MPINNYKNSLENTILLYIYKQLYIYIIYIQLLIVNICSFLTDYKDTSNSDNRKFILRMPSVLIAIATYDKNNFHKNQGVIEF